MRPTPIWTEFRRIRSIVSSTIFYTDFSSISDNTTSSFILQPVPPPVIILPLFALMVIIIVCGMAGRSFKWNTFLANCFMTAYLHIMKTVKIYIFLQNMCELGPADFDASVRPFLYLTIFISWTCTSTRLLRPRHSTFCQISTSYWSRSTGRSTVLVEVKFGHKKSK